MTNESKTFDLRERLLKFSKRILEIVKMLPRSPESDVLRKQLAAAGTSIGANYEEADGAISKRDFTHKMVIARKEANETKYWLRVISGDFIQSDEIDGDIKEATEIIKIFSSIISKTRKKRD
jgi:four helix bundle protein